MLAGLMYACTTNTNPDITAEELSDHTSYLASEELAGRYPGTAGDRAAAEYILEKFENYGLDVSEPAGLQEMEITTSVAIGDSNHLIWSGKELGLSKDFLPLSYSKNGLAEGYVVFAGYGVQADKSGIIWDDYRGIDMNGKIALLLEGGPEQPETGDDPFEGLLSQRSKILRAQDLGAVAVIFVAGPLYDDSDLLEFANIKEAPAVIPTIRISRIFANKVLESTGRTIEDLEASNQTASQGPLLLDHQLSIQTHVIPQKVKTHNVIGIVRAPQGPYSDEYMVFGGHYDHLGLGGPGTGTRVPDTTAVHYGADDNASGTAGIIELAGYFAGKQKELSRSMIFVAFAAEEMGLLGSKYFVENPPVEIDQIESMFNLDMIGRLNEEKRIAVGGTGTAAEFDSLLSKVNSGGLNLNYSPEGSGPSDHASFYAENIPVLYFSTGAHPDYHTPGDSVGKLNFEGMNKVTHYLAGVALAVNQVEDLNFREAGPKRTVSHRQNLKVTLGFMPDFTDNSNTGMKVDFPTPGKPADRAGIKKGDRIVGINGMKVTNIQDYMVRLKALEPGQIVTVDVERDEEKLVLLVQL